MSARCKGTGGQRHPGGLALAWRHEVRDVQIGWPAFVIDPDRGHQVEAQQGQVDEVIPGQALVAQMGVHEPEAAKASMAGPEAADLGQDDAGGVSDENVLHGALPGDEHADLPADAMGSLAEKGSQLRRDDVRRIHMPPIDPLEGRELGRLETSPVAGDLVHAMPVTPGRS